MRKAEDIYKELFDKVTAIVTGWREDLTKHDKGFIESDPSLPFLHFTRKNGTHMVVLYPADHSSWPEKAQKVPYMYGGPRCRHRHLQGIIDWTKAICGLELQVIYYFDGETFSEVDTKRAMEIAQDHVEAVKKIWAD